MITFVLMAVFSFALLLQVTFFIAKAVGVSNVGFLDVSKIVNYSQAVFCASAVALIFLLFGAEVFFCVITLSALFIVGVDYFFFVASRRSLKVESDNYVLSFCREYALIFLVLLVIKSFVIQHYNVPTGSLEPTVRPGDFILVNQFAYGLHLPVFNTKIASYGNPERGDIVVFRYPLDPYNMSYVKRVVGLPGDHIVYKDKKLSVNGQVLNQIYLGPEDSMYNKNNENLVKKREFFNYKSHDILIREGDYSYPKDDIDVVVEPGSYFMLGDNRDNSNDSRFWGSVDEKYLIGKGQVVLLGWDFSKGVFGWPNFSRVGKWL